MNKAPKTYIGKLTYGISTLLTGLKTTGMEFFTKKVTEQYPENRDSLKMYDRFRGTLVMPHDAEGKNKCIACGLCQSVCPNDTLHLEIGSVQDEETGKSKKVMLKYQYDLGACMFCQLCVNICPTNAIEFSTEFEHAVFERDKLEKILNK